MGGLDGQSAQTQAQTPPPVPQAGYHVAKDGASIGPFSLEQLAQMVAAGAFGAESLVWKQGMAEWRRAGDVGELASVFSNEPAAGMPPIPPTA